MGITGAVVMNFAMWTPLVRQLFDRDDIVDQRQLRNLVALAEELNFTRAAARCHISQPPLSRSIAMLEAELGVRLFDRDRHSVQLTEAGHGLLQDARRILSLTEEAAERVRRVARGLRGTLTLGFGGSSIYSHWPQVVRAFSDAVPDVRIVFRSMAMLEQVDALREGVIDLGLIRLPVTDELITTEFAYSEQLVVALPAKHPLLQQRAPINLAALATSEFVTYEPRRGFNYYADLHALCRLAGFKPKIAQEGHSTEAVVGIVACGQGVAILPGSAHRLQMRGVDFRALDVRDVPPQLATVTFGHAWRKQSPSAVTLEFIEHARSTIETSARTAERSKRRLRMSETADFD